MRRALVLVLALGCGRIGFGELEPVSVEQARGTLSVGNSFACVIREAQVWCWGEAGAGQLGVPDLSFSATPLLVAGLPEVTTIAAGGAHVCAVTVAGEVYCWGSNDASQLGSNTPLDKPRPPSISVPEPIRVATLPLPAIAVGAGAAHTCALLTDLTVWCWGANAGGQLGRGTVQDINELPAVVAGVSEIAELAIADDSSCVRATTGTVTCWGENGTGHLGDGTNVNRGTPRAIPNLRATALVLGGDHACALVDSGQYTCWGKNNFGEHGNGTDVGTNVPDPPSVLAGFVAITASFNHTCGLRDDGRVSCWGANFDGMLGDGTTIAHSTPIEVETGGRVAAISAGNSSTCAIREDDTVMCWGWGSRGGVGDGRQARPTAQRVNLTASSIAAGRTHVCALVANGDVACWGNNSNGQLGDNTRMSSPSPVTVQRAWQGAAVELAIGDLFTCIRTVVGEAWCWGNNDFGQLGDNTNNTSATPVMVAVGDLTRLAAGDAHACGVRASDSKVLCWGYNGDGALGDGTTTSSAVPVQALDEVDADLTATELALGEFHSCALRGVEVLCWGDNDKGQVGSGTLDRTSGIVVPGVTADSLIAGGASACANDPNNPTPMCWGSNDGNILTPVDNSPLPPTRSANPDDFQIARVNSCHPTAGCWGSNFLGQLGNGSYADRSDPGGPIIDLPTTVTSITVGYDFACAIANGEAYCWGDNAHGQLGIGTTTRALEPVAVIGL